jgi:hypothetical protein
MNLLIAAKGALATLSQNAVLPCDVALAKKWLAEGIAAAEIQLPPKPTHVCVDETLGRVIGRDLQTGKPIHVGKWEAV